MKPSEIRFKQDSIASYFQDGRGDINDAIRRIQSGYLSPYDFPPIKVVQKDRKVYSFDNRRLYVFRVCEVLGCVREIPVEIRPAWQLRLDTFTTLDDGRTIRVRQGVTENHCLDHWLRERDTAGNWNLPGQTILAKDTTNNLDSVDGRSSTITNVRPSAEINSPNNTNIFAISHSVNLPKRLPPTPYSDDSAQFPEDDINNNVPPSPNFDERSSDISIINLPGSSHSRRVHIAASFGGSFDNPLFLPQRKQSFISERKSSLDASICESTISSQDSRLSKLQMAIVVQPEGTKVSRPIGFQMFLGICVATEIQHGPWGKAKFVGARL